MLNASDLDMNSNVECGVGNGVDKGVDNGVDVRVSNVSNIANAIEVLQRLPQDCSITLIEKFLSQTIRHTLCRFRHSMLVKGLVVNENRNVRYEKMIAERECVTLSDDRVCTVCSAHITDAQFVWFPTFRLVMHTHCRPFNSIESQ